MIEGTYSKSEVCKILGFNENEFDTFLKDSVEINQSKKKLHFYRINVNKKSKKF